MIRPPGSVTGGVVVVVRRALVVVAMALVVVVLVAVARVLVVASGVVVLVIACGFVDTEVDTVERSEPRATSNRAIARPRQATARTPTM